MTPSSTSTIVVTGASSGIGRATAVELARSEHRVYAAARRERELQALAETHPGITGLALDVTDPTSVAAARDQVRADTGGGGPDVLVNAAGVAALGPIEATPLGEMRRQFDVNVLGALAVTQSFLPDMRARRAGRIVNISSVLGRFTLPGTGAYAASKYALEAISDALRVELAPFGIAVVLVEPGLAATELFEPSTAASLDYTGTKAEYHKLFTAGAGLSAKLSRAAVPSQEVAHTVARAATAPRPRVRYIPGARNSINIKILTNAPTRAVDRIKARLMELDPKGVATT
jgi:NAD(P)-dependent dehydrogenase (short-subunit alcohol dehydrogenase family)